MENLVVNRKFWKNKKVFISGHTGFKGGWLALWLADMGAEVHGYALDPPTPKNFFNISRLSNYLKSHIIGDIRNIDFLKKSIQNTNPEIVFHLAAQPLVKYSYSNALETYSTNVIGTINLFEAILTNSSVKSVVNITTDKCYENREWVWAYREYESLGGYDPYSSSKACSEIVTASYRRSFFNAKNIHLASARAGNVIGGGDWASDRLIPDFMRALNENNILSVRFPKATRPWQHVLEPLSGYLKLAEKLYTDGENFASAWNFGPNDSDLLSVESILTQLCKWHPKAKWQIENVSNHHEAMSLRLDNTKSKTILGWFPRWSINKAIEKVIEWHRGFDNDQNMTDISLNQIKEYEN